MITRKEIEARYEIAADGVIKSPGKFEGEMLYTPYYYELMMNGEGADIDDCDCESCERECDSCDCEVCDIPTRTEIEVDDEDRLEFPELSDVQTVIIGVDLLGFVNLTVL